MSHHAVNLTSVTSCAVVGTLMNFTCSVNGTPPLTIVFQDNNMDTINQSVIATNPEDGSAVRRSVLSLNVSQTGPMLVTCVASNSTSHEATSSVQITGLG